MTTNSSDDFSANSNGMFASGGNANSTAADYYNWTWKQIEAAINGGSEVATSAGQEQAASLSSPTTLWNAGNTFQYVQEVLSMVATALSDQANALAGGSDAPWQGQAADAFYDTMTLYSKQVAANAEELSGGAAGVGGSIPDLLVQSGNQLSSAQAQISAIDSWYAQQAINQGASVSNGLVQVHDIPSIPPMMTADMLKVLLSLAGQYHTTYSALAATSLTSPNTGSGTTDTSSSPSSSKKKPSPNSPNSPSVSGGTPAYLDRAALSPASPASPASPTGLLARQDAMGPAAASPGSSSGGLATANPSAAGLKDAAVSPYTAAGASPGASLPSSSAGGIPDFDKALAASPGAASPGAAGGLGGATGGLTSPDAGADVLPYTGSKLAASPGAETLADSPVDDAAVSPYPGTGTGAAGDSGVSPAAGIPLAGFPGGAGAGAGSDSGLGAPGAVTPFTSKLATGPAADDGTSPLGDGAVSPYPGAVGGAAAQSGAAGGGFPYMPGAGAGGAGAGAPGVERSDASGLLGDETEPWAGGDSGAASEGLPGAGAGGAGLTGLGTSPSLKDATSPGADGVSAYPGSTGAAASDGAGGGGFPYMPGAGAGGAGAGAPGGERSDASGLLGDETEPWTGGTSATGDSDALPGATAGGAGLVGNAASTPVAVYTADNPASPADASSPDAEQADELPIMPGVGAGAGAGSDQRAGERSDASGLIGGETEPWAHDDAVIEPDAAQGAVPGGLGLDSHPDLYSHPEHSHPEHEQEELPGDRVAVLPQDSPDDIAAWDTATAAAELLLLAGSRRRRNDDEGDITTTKFGTEEEAWRGSPADDGIGEPEEETGLATWRPSATASNQFPAAGDDLRCSGSAGEPVEEEETEPPEEAADENTADRGNPIANLLVQDSALWGAWQDNTGALD
jgi:hypothetical protein